MQPALDAPDARIYRADAAERAAPAPRRRGVSMQALTAVLVALISRLVGLVQSYYVPAGAATPPEPHFTEAHLLGILSRAATVQTSMIGASAGVNVSDALRMMNHTGVRYAGRTAWVWGGEDKLPGYLTTIKANAAQAHALMPDLILEGCIFEIVTKAGVEKIPVPRHVFEAFGLPATRRNFRYDAMRFPRGTLCGGGTTSFCDGMWGPNTTVPDLTQLESRLWFFFVGTSWILQGIEGLHVGQIMLMSKLDARQGMILTADLFSKLRIFARSHARRGFVLINAHLFEDPFVHFNQTDQLLFDFHAFPSRPQPVCDAPKNQLCAMKPNGPGPCTLQPGKDKIYLKSAGGVSVWGWSTKSLPYIVEFDNGGCTSHPGVAWQNNSWGAGVWGWDEISWYAHQPPAYRNEWLSYAVHWLAHNDPAGHFEMAMRRGLCDSKFGKAYEGRPDVKNYDASSDLTSGFDQEAVIAQLWAKQ